MDEKKIFLQKAQFLEGGKVISCNTLDELLELRESSPDLRLVSVIRKDGVIVPNTNCLTNYLLGKLIYGYLFLSSKLLDTDTELMIIGLMDRNGLIFPLHVPIKICDFNNIAVVYNKYVSDHEKEIIGLDDKTFSLSVTEVFNNIENQRELLSNPYQKKSDNLDNVTE